MFALASLPGKASEIFALKNYNFEDVITLGYLLLVYVKHPAQNRLLTTITPI